jgi:hypothetical protein
MILYNKLAMREWAPPIGTMGPPPGPGAGLAPITAPPVPRRPRGRTTWSAHNHMKLLLFFASGPSGPEGPALLAMTWVVGVTT